MPMQVAMVVKENPAGRSAYAGVYGAKENPAGRVAYVGVYGGQGEPSS